MGRGSKGNRCNPALGDLVWILEYSLQVKIHTRLQLRVILGVVYSMLKGEHLITYGQFTLKLSKSLEHDTISFRWHTLKYALVIYRVSNNIY